jgi:signal transduction histidine kinase
VAEQFPFTGLCWLLTVDAAQDLRGSCILSREPIPDLPTATQSSAEPQPRGADAARWKILVDAIEQLSAARNFARIIDIVKHAARRVASADGATVVLREDNLCYYVEEDAISPLWKGHKFPMHSCISGWAMANRQVVVVPDIYADARIPHDAYRPTFVKSLVMIPVRVEDPLAAIGTYWAKPYVPDAAEVELLESLARATAIAISNVNLETSLREAALRAEQQAAEIERAAQEMQQAAARQHDAEAQLRQAHKMEAIGQLTGGIAHDFNNLLTVVVGNLDTLIPRLQQVEERKLAEEALSGALRGAELTRQLLMFARRQDLAPAPTDVSHLLQDTGTMLRRTLGDAITLSIKVPTDLWWCQIDAGQLENALLNIAINARDAMPEGGALTIEASPLHIDAALLDGRSEIGPGDYVKISVTDSGCGIPADIRERVFEPFFTTKNVGEGTGLGLAMVYSFAKQSDGHVSLYSEVGVGTTINLYLPRSLVEGDVRPGGDGFPVARVGHETILVVDDHDAVRQMSSATLTGLGYQVIEARDAGEAIDILHRHTPIDLVFTDIAMPGGLSGFDLAKHVVHNHPKTKVVLVSGFAENASRERGNVPAHIKLLAKPFRRQELADCIRDTLDAPL